MLYALGLLILTFPFCETSRTKAKPDIPQSEILYATLYNYYSAEYKALALQAYNIASERILQIRRDNPYHDSLAIILDLDETVLDNSPYQAKLILDQIEYDSLWNDWCNLAIARAIPGALEFVRLADSLGFHVIYLSNRKAEFVLEKTMLNLRNIGFPQVEKEKMLLRTSVSNKEPRREIVRKNYEICLLVGDNLGDFFVDDEAPEGRNEQTEYYADQFGEKFIILPNAMYGNWVQSLNLLNDPQQSVFLLDSMVKELNLGLIDKP